MQSINTIVYSTTPHSEWLQSVCRILTGSHTHHISPWWEIIDRKHQQFKFLTLQCLFPFYFLFAHFVQYVVHTHTHCIYPFFPFAILPLLLLLEECQQTSRLEFLNEALDDRSLDGLGGYTDTWMDEWMSAWYNIHPYIFIESLRNVKAFFFGMGSEKNTITPHETFLRFKSCAWKTLERATVRI